MLPSKGYFNTINCPFFEYAHEKCRRPHCHFRHTKKEKSSDDLPQSEEKEENVETIKANEDLYNISSDINNKESVTLENNQELWLSQQPKNVKYKPTPIAELQKRHIPVSTAPSMSASQHLRRRVEDKRKSKAEYNPSALKTNHSPATSLYKATKIKDSPKDSTDNHELFVNTILHKDSNEEDNLSQLGDDSEEEIDFDQISTAFNFLDEFLNDYDNKPKNMSTSGRFENCESDKSMIRDNTDSNCPPNSAGTNSWNGHFDNILTNCNEDSSNKIENDCSPKLYGMYVNRPEKQNESEQKMKSAYKENNESFGSDNKTNSIIERKHTKSKSSNHQKNIQNNSTKRTSEHLSESKQVKKNMTDGEPRIDKCAGRDMKKENHHNRNKEKYETSTKKENSKSVNKSSKKESTHSHKSNSSYKEDNHTKVSSNKLSKKESEYKNNSSTSSSKESESQHTRNSSKAPKEKSAIRKKEPISSLHEHHMNSKTKDESRSKRSSSEKSHISGKHKEAKHWKEVSDKKKQRKKRSNSQSDDGSENHSPPKRMREKIEAAIVVDDDDDVVEIVNDTVSVIVIDSEEESSDQVKEETARAKNKHRSPTPDRSPILPSGDSSSDSADVVMAAAKPNTVMDDTTQVDHRVMNCTKNRVSLGSRWIPTAKKHIPLVTPHFRNELVRKNAKEQEENEVSDGQAAARIKIGCVPNVNSLLEDKKRLLALAKNKRSTAMNSSHASLPSLRNLNISERIASSTIIEDEDKPPRVLNKAHPLNSGAPSDKRQLSVEALYKIGRQLVKPGYTYQSAQENCLRLEEKIWLRNKHNTYSAAIKKQLLHMSSMISDFTLEYYKKIEPKASSMYLTMKVAGNLQNPNKRNMEESIRLYDALQKYILTSEQLEIEGYPRRKMDPFRSDLAYVNEESVAKYRKTPPIPPRGHKVCSKCQNFYIVDDDGLSIDKRGCNYHGKRAVYVEGMRAQRKKLHRCCNQPPEKTCMSSPYHASESKDPNRLEGFIETQDPVGPEPQDGWGVFALDCEMYWSSEGIELGRVTVVNADERIVYDTCVRPVKKVADYCTRMSGLTKESLSQAKVNLLEVQAALLQIINSKTILIGHSLENDLKVLKLIHNTVVDTAVVFQDQDRKVALKVLAKDLLNEVIQNEEDGHDSAEDAVTCIKLMRLKMLKEYSHSNKSRAPVMKMRYAKSNMC